jgi:hypothetical protein
MKLLLIRFLGLFPNGKPLRGTLTLHAESAIRATHAIGNKGNHDADHQEPPEEAQKAVGPFHGICVVGHFSS